MSLLKQVGLFTLVAGVFLASGISETTAQTGGVGLTITPVSDTTSVALTATADDAVSRTPSRDIDCVMRLSGIQARGR